jgi:hypothetical protein
MKMIKPITGVLLIVVFSLSACVSTHYLAPVEESKFLTLREIHIVLDDGSEVRLKNCVLEGDLLIGLTRDNRRVEVELSRIRVAYYTKIKPTMPFLAVFSAGTVGISIWLLVAAFTAPSETP